MIKPNFATKTALVAEYIRRGIIEGQLRPKERLQEERIAEQLGVSTTPVREALYQVEVEGLVSRIPHRGVVVTALPVEDANDLVILQTTLQSLVVRMNIPKMDREEIQLLKKLHEEMKDCFKNQHFSEMRWLDYKFHMLLCGVTRLPWLTRVISGLWVHFPARGFEEIPGFANQSIQHHSRILTAAGKKDVEGVISIIKKHFDLDRISAKKNA